MSPTSNILPTISPLSPHSLSPLLSFAPLYPLIISHLSLFHSPVSLSQSLSSLTCIYPPALSSLALTNHLLYISPFAVSPPSHLHHISPPVAPLSHLLSNPLPSHTISLFLSIRTDMLTHFYYTIFVYTSTYFL